MNVLVCSIIRNEVPFLDTWRDQLVAIARTFPQDSFGLSVVENDSTDGSFAQLARYDWPGFQNVLVAGGRFNAPLFSGGRDFARVNNLAAARNRAMYTHPFLSTYSHILWVESDITYTMDTVDRLLHHEQHYGRPMHVFSPKSIHHDRPIPPNIYDAWGTRMTAASEWWKDEDGDTGGYQQLWATWNCLCLYDAAPIKAGCAFSGTNPRTRKTDCDTTTICESFRLKGFDQIYWDTNLTVSHHGA